MMVDQSSLRYVHRLGEGSYGYVALVEHPVYGFYAKKTSSIHLKENLDKELRIMHRFRNNPRIVQASSDHVHVGTASQGCHIYMEYASEGTLEKMISSFPKRTLPEHMIQRATRMILEGLVSLHWEGYVHCDLKPANVLVFPSATDGELWDLKLSDFGSAKEPNTDPFTLCGGTKPYMSPEAFKDGPYGVIDQAFDIWSLGCVVYAMFGGKPHVERCEELYDWMLPKGPQVISPVAKDFLRLCHGVHPMHKVEATALGSRLRPTAAELLTHPFITQTLTVPLPTIQVLTGPLSTTRQQEPLPELPDFLW